MHIDAGESVVILAGSHIGCVELIGGNGVRSTRELKGKTVSVSELRRDEQIFMSKFAAHVGLDPQKDINWAIHPWVNRLRLLAEGKIRESPGPPDSGCRSAQRRQTDPVSPMA